MNTQLTRNAALGLLGLQRGATPEEIRNAHRDLVKVWHPDRFGADPPLRARAEGQLKLINAAMDILLSTSDLAENRDAGPPRGAQGLKASSPEPYGLTYDDVGRLRIFRWRLLNAHLIIFLAVGTGLVLWWLEPKTLAYWLGSFFGALIMGAMFASIPAIIVFLFVEFTLALFWPKFRSYRRYSSDNNLPW